MLIIAEKPKMGLAIAEALGIKKKDKGFIELKNGDIVTWSVGHILEFADPDAYLPKLPEGKKRYWNAQDLPIMPEEFKLIPSLATKDQFNIVKGLIAKHKEICHAGDPDREGQLLVDEIFTYLGVKNKDIKRVWLPDLTEKGILNAFKKLESNTSAKYVNMSKAALSRSKIDWLMGMNLTRAFTLAYGSQGGRGVKSFGRVQTPTLGLVVARDLERENFVPTDHYKPIMTAEHKNGELMLLWDKIKADEKYKQGLNSEDLLTDKKIADLLVQDMTGQKGIVSLYKTKDSKKAAPLPYSLSNIQKIGAKYGYGVQEVLDTMQSLYEKGFTSYPRTDCNYLPEDVLNDAPAILACISDKFSDFEGYDIRLRHAAFNDKKLSAHNAIMPLENDKPLSELNDKEKTLYELVCKSFFQLFMPDKEILTTFVEVKAGTETWKAQISVVTKSGWDIYKEEEEESEGRIPKDLKEGDTVHVAKVELKAEKTTPPPAFTEGSLAEAMKFIYKYVPKDCDKKLIEILKSTQGLGTEATRASIIETLKKRGFLEVKGKNIVSTEEGRDFISVVPEDLKDPIMTAIWENQLSKIEKGEADCNSFIRKAYETLPGFVEQALETEFNHVTANTYTKSAPKKKTGYKKGYSKKIKKIYN